MILCVGHADVEVMFLYTFTATRQINNVSWGEQKDTVENCMMKICSNCNQTSLLWFDITIVTENCKWFLCIWILATLLSPDKLWSKYLLAPAHPDSAEQEWFSEIFPQTLFKLLFKNIGAISTWPDCDRLDIVGILIKNLKKKYFQKKPQMHELNIDSSLHHCHNEFS